jgi:branched-chain amino acid transport system substrate-binding protein
MLYRRRSVLLGAAGLVSAILQRPTRAAEALPAIKIGVLTDLSGAYRDASGPTTVLAAHQAVEDFRPEQHGFTATVIAADHGQKVDLGSAIARKWFDQDGVDAIADLNNTSVALAVSSIAKEKDKTLLISGGASADLSASACTANQVQFALDTYAAGHTTAKAVLAAGGDTWFMITPNYAFGRTLEQEVSTLIQSNGGKVLGNAVHPFPGTTDFSAFLLEAQASGAKVLGLCNSGGDMANCIKQAHEFGLPQRGIKVVALFGFIQQVKSIGLDLAQGLQISESFYWDQNNRTRAFTKRLVEQSPANYPNSIHASCYAAVTHYLKAVASLQPASARSGQAVVAEMKRTPTDDDCFGSNRIQENGRFLCPVSLYAVKAPAASMQPWDLYTPLATVPGAEAFQPAAESHCPLVRL